jgi:hypothetical protein
MFCLLIILNHDSPVFMVLSHDVDPIDVPIGSSFAPIFLHTPLRLTHHSLNGIGKWEEFEKGIDMAKLGGLKATNSNLHLFFALWTLHV